MYSGGEKGREIDGTAWRREGELTARMATGGLGGLAASFDKRRARVQVGREGGREGGREREQKWAVGLGKRRAKHGWHDARETTRSLPCPCLSFPPSLPRFLLPQRQADVAGAAIQGMKLGKSFMDVYASSGPSPGSTPGMPQGQTGGKRGRAAGFFVSEKGGRGAGLYISDGCLTWNKSLDMSQFLCHRASSPYLPGPLNSNLPILPLSYPSRTETHPRQA